MDLRHLDYFVAVAEELHFTRAAQRLHATQSTVSAGIRSLERELGAELFLRSKPKVALTPAGEALLPDAREALDALDRMRSAAAATNDGLRGRVRVGIFTNLDVLDLPAIMGEFHRTYPQVELRLIASPTGTTGLADDLRAGRVDVAFMGLPAAELPGLQVSPLIDVPITALLPRGHPLAGRESLGLAELADERFVDSPEGFGNRVMADRLFGAAGMTRHVAVEVGELLAIHRYVARGLGVAVLPALGSSEGCVRVPLSDQYPKWSLSIATRAGVRRTPAVAALVAAVLEARAGAGFRTPD